MAIEIYQSNAGYLWVEDREIPLVNTEWIHSVSMGYDYITIKNGDSIAINNAPLRHIVDNSGSGYANLVAWTAWWNTLLTNNVRPYFVYTALLTQSGTDVPLPTILENTLGAAVWSRTGAGTYLLTKAGAFAENKTIPNNTDLYTDYNGNKITLERTSADVMTLKTYAAADTEVLADGVLTSQYLNIKVYE